MYWKITRDHLNEEYDDMPTRVGFQTKSKEIVGELLDVKLLDDDRELYYEAISDDEALESLYQFGYTDAGVTILQVLKDGAWVDEIG